MKIRSALAAFGASIMLIAAVPGVAQAKDAYPPGVTPVSCKVSAVSNASKIKVNMGPNQPGNRYYTFRIDVRREGGGWLRYLKTFKTQGKAETRTVNVPSGTYRVRCNGKFGFVSATSNTVNIRR
ncbi:MAG TPA: hypothetical protein VES02_00060 [Dermatophilaceae bacterium]|nr:hypothetical protein [Dermatophilaceae bacterium]